MIRLAEDIFAVPDGELHPRWFKAGEDVSGAVAEAAIAQGKAAKPSRKAMKPPENK